ncbi:MAG TPA: glutamate--tRNA ligase [Polyangiaceae bacterium]|jgi:glutamyl-tRNA synthetase|nr:glutamate--tRNA ligase [Polyangiaceae bacterium]
MLTAGAMTLRMRFAPSPSGYLHIGNVRSTLFTWLWCKSQGGTFILRVEDTDQERSSIDSVRAVLDDLKWLGLPWDEGPEVEGPYGPYFQSERRPIYHAHVEQLIGEKKAYRCYCTKEELDAQREALKAKNPKANFVYPGTCRDRTDQPDLPFVVRFRAPTTGSTDFTDRVFGFISTPNSAQQDFVLMRTDGYPLYNLAATIDDHLMNITFVVRGRDHIGNTPQQILLYRAFGWEPPEFGHLPMMLSSKGEKLSKRNGSVSVKEYRDKGYTPMGVLNYLVRFGWSSGDREIFTRDELIRLFSWDHVNKGDGKFDEKKFADVAFEQLKRPELTSLDQYAEWVKPFLALRGIDAPDEARLLRAIVGIRERARTLVDAAHDLDFYFREPPEFDDKAKQKFLTPAAAPHLKALHTLFEGASDWQPEALESAFKHWVESSGLSMKDVAQPARVALTGRSASPPLFDVLAVLGKAQSLTRLARAADIAQAG